MPSCNKDEYASGNLCCRNCPAGESMARPGGLRALGQLGSPWEGIAPEAACVGLARSPCAPRVNPRKHASASPCSVAQRVAREGRREEPGPRGTPSQEGA